ncbi:MAG: ferrochelatase [Aquificae bacterium]|nr:ferrochelatase [Aquificota bacterium]
MKKTAVILLNMGGPDSLEAIEPFLYNLFSDHDIIQIPKPIQKPLAKLIAKIRAKKTREYYQYMGGKSPQKEQTLDQARELQNILGDRYIVTVAMRYWYPFTEEALEKLKDENIDKIVLLPLYPQYSRTTTGSSFNEFYRNLKKFQKEGYFKNTKIIQIEDYHDHPLFIKAWVELIKEYVKDKDYYFLFSAHSLPEKIIKKGDPYKAQVEKTVELIMENFPDTKYSIAYQSKVGPVKWLEPMTDREIIDLAKRGIKKLAVIPVTFVSEHSETLYELDKQYGSLAQEHGIESYLRIPTLQTQELFIQALKDIVTKQNT